MTIITERTQSVSRIDNSARLTAKPTLPFSSSFSSSFSSPSFYLGSITALAATVMLSGCHTTPVSMNAYSQSPIAQAISGDYAKREGGSELAVMIRPQLTDGTAINIRTRHDDASDTIDAKQHVSCHFEGTATLMGQDDAHGVIFQTVSHGSATFLQFKNGILTIDAQNQQALSHLCSGGATLAGKYQKLS